MKSILEVLNFDIWTFIFMTINLIVVIFFLQKFLYEPVGKILAKRENKIASSLQKAEEDKTEAQALLAKYEDRIAGAKAEAQKIIAEANRFAEEIRTKANQEARAEAEQTLVKAQNTIVAEKIQALTELQAELGNLIVAGAEQVIARRLSLQDHKAIVGEFVDQQLAALIEQYLKEGNWQDDLAEAEVKTAVELETSELQAIEQKLRQALGRNVTVKATVVANLIGGITLQIGEILINGSLAGRLMQMKETLA